MNESDLLKLLDNIVSLSLLLLVWQLERQRNKSLEHKLTRYEDIFIDEYKTNRAQSSVRNSSEG